MSLAADAVLLDLDGTLIDSTAAVVRSWLRWADEHAVDPRRLVGSHGRPAGEIVADLVPVAALAAARARIDAIELEDLDGVVPLPGAVELLGSLPAGRWAVVTSCTAALAAARIRAADLPTPPVLVTADDVRRGKPHPEPFLLGAARLGADPARCVVVEDAPSGLAAAVAAGMATVAVTTTHERHQLVADLVVGGPADIHVANGASGLRLAART